MFRVAEAKVSAKSPCTVSSRCGLLERSVERVAVDPCVSCAGPGLHAHIVDTSTPARPGSRACGGLAGRDRRPGGVSSPPVREPYRSVGLAARTTVCPAMVRGDGPYFGLVHPVLERVHWSPLRERTPFAHPIFAGYHLLVLSSLLSVSWLLISFALLTTASFLCRASDRGEDGKSYRSDRVPRSRGRGDRRRRMVQILRNAGQAGRVRRGGGGEWHAGTSRYEDGLSARQLPGRTRRCGGRPCRPHAGIRRTAASSTKKEGVGACTCPPVAGDRADPDGGSPFSRTGLQRGRGGGGASNGGDRHLLSVEMPADNKSQSPSDWSGQRGCEEGAGRTVGVSAASNVDCGLISGDMDDRGSRRTARLTTILNVALGGALLQGCDGAVDAHRGCARRFAHSPARAHGWSGSRTRTTGATRSREAMTFSSWRSAPTRVTVRAPRFRDRQLPQTADRSRR